MDVGPDKTNMVQWQAALPKPKADKLNGTKRRRREREREKFFGASYCLLVMHNFCSGFVL